MIRASSLEARPATGVAPFMTHLKELPELQLLDALPPPVGVAASELSVHEPELLTIPLHSAWPVFAYALREAHVDGDRLLASFYLFPTAAAERRRQAVGQLHIKARVGEPGLSDAWVEGSGLVFDRSTAPAPEAPSEVLELGAAAYDEDEDEEDEDYEELGGGGGFSLQVLFQQAEEAVEQRGAEAAALAPAPAPPRAPVKRVAPAPVEATLPPIPRSKPPPAAWELPPPRVLIGFGVFLALCAFKIATDWADEDEVATHEAEGRLPPLPDPFEASPLDPLPGDVVATVQRKGKPTVLGPIRRRLLNRYMELAEPGMAWCYHAYLLDEPGEDQTGDLELKFLLSETGEIAQVEIGQSALSGAGLGDCLKEALGKVPFPQPEVASVTAASYKFHFGLRMPVVEDAPLSTPAVDPWSLLLAATFAGLVAVAVTRLIERFGGLLGGLLGTLPTTIVPAALGIFDQAPSREAFVAAMCMTPVGMFIDALFLWLWRALPPRLPPMSLRARLSSMVALTLSAWALAALAAVSRVKALQAAGLPMPAVGVVTTLAIVLVGVLACLRPPPAPSGKRPVSPFTLVARGSLAAVAIAVSILLSAWGSPLLAGVATVFPAIFLTTMVSLWLSQGEAVPAGAVGPMMLGSSAVAAYALLAAWLLPAYGPLAGGALAWVLAAGGFTLPATLWLRRRHAAPVVASGSARRQS